MKDNGGGGICAPKCQTGDCNAYPFVLLFLRQNKSYPVFIISFKYFLFYFGGILNIEYKQF